MQLIRTFFLIIVLFFSYSYIFAQGQAGLSGIVLDANNNEVVKTIVIKLTSKGKTGEYRTETDLLGCFSFKNIYGGDYLLSLTRIGYKSKSIDVNIKDFENKVFTITLEPATVEIEKINITATRTEQTLQKTPSSINLISSEDIRRKNKFTFDEVLQDVQGVSINRTSGINISALSIRGSSDVAGGGIGNRVLLLVDGRPSLTGDSKGALWSLIPVSVIERTEVVKGAFSSLYGSSAIGGVVNVITKRSTFKPFTSINMNLGFYNVLSDSLKFNDNIQKLAGLNILHSNTVKKFSYLLDFDYKKNEGYSEITNYNFYSGFAKISYDLFSNRDIELKLQYTNSESGYPHYWRVDPGKLPEPYKTSPLFLGDKINKETQSIDFSYYSLPSNKTKFSSKFYYYKLNSISTYNPNNPVSIQYGTPGKEFKTYITSYNFGNISQLDYEISRSHYLMSGVDVQWNVVHSSPEDILYGDQQQNNLGIFIQDQWNILKQENGESILTSTIGGRVDYNAFVGGSNTFQISPKFSILYSPVVDNRVLENTSFRFLIGRAFRAPSIAEQYFKKELFGGFNFIFNPDLKPERMYSIEFGLRKQYKTRFIFDFAFFLNLYDDLIQYVNIGNNSLGPFQVKNISKSQSRGFDFMVEYNSGINLFNEKLGYKFEVDYTFNDARDLSANRVDDILPYKPRHLFNSYINLEYFGFNFNVSFKYVSRIEKVIFYKYEEPKAYNLFNTKLSKQISKKINLYFAINNIFDTFYQELERIVAPNRNYNFGLNIEL